MQILSNIASRLVAFIDGICTFLMLILLAVISYQVFARYVLNNPPSWSEELARFLVVWITMLGSAVLVNKEGHISVDFLVNRLPSRAKRLLSFIRDALTIFLCASHCRRNPIPGGKHFPRSALLIGRVAGYRPGARWPGFRWLL